MSLVLRWPLLALLGLLVAATIAFLATRAVNTDIGISSEPPSAGRALSPAAPGTAHRHHGRGTGTVTITSPSTTPVPVPAPSPAPSPSSGDGGERGDD